MKCYLCEGVSFSAVNGVVRDLPQNKILECCNCGLVFLEDFSHIKDGFYENSGMYNNERTPKHELADARKDDDRRFHYTKELICNKDVLDFGCGYAGYLSMARDCANVCDGLEVNKRAEEVFDKSGMTLYNKIEDIPSDKKYDVITLFHVLEHLSDPRSTLKKLSNVLRDNGCIIIEVPNSKDALLSLYNSHEFARFTYWSCHLMLFDANNLSLLLKQSGFKKQYIKQIQRYPLSNHIYWLAKGLPNGHKELDFLNCEMLDKAYEKKLASVGCCDTIITKVNKIGYNNDYSS